MCYDILIVGGGIAGTYAAITAARLGLKTVLIHERPVFGGNASGEIVPNDTSYENGWMNFTLCSVTKRLNLKKGSNVLKITVNGGATCNMDYLELATCASLTHSYAA